MGRIQKKGKKGAAANYVTRNQAIKKLQLKLSDFRRLCILKGIYPREPKNKRKISGGNSAPKTYYWVKDIAFLAHEPLLAKFREYKVFARKLRKALGKHQLSIARSLEQNKPNYTLDHIIKERYPSFVDAVRDLDDALCLLFLFARMPQTDSIQSEMVQRCVRLCSEFQHYVIITRSLQKVFLSIKGIYYQATISGQQVTWIVPYPFTQTIPNDVDFKIMLTFLELYETLVGFVNFKLYHEENLAYPPVLDTSLEDGAAGLSALQVRPISQRDMTQISTTDQQPQSGTAEQQRKRLKSLPVKMASLVEHDANNTDSAVNDTEEQPAMEVTLDEFPQDEASSAVTRQTNKIGGLFEGLVFFLNREVPRESLEFVIRSFGGKIGWQDAEGSPYTETSKEITHHIVDRPVVNKEPLRDYIQPQWVYDSVNVQRLLPVDIYGPDAKLPPHLSPFVQAKEGEYDPTKTAEEPEEEEEQNKVDGEAEEEEEEEGEEEAEEEEEEGEEEEEEEEEEIKKAPPKKQKRKSPVVEHELDEDEQLHQEELAAEAAGISFSEYHKQKQGATKHTATPRKKSRTVEKSQEEEEKELAKIMMGKRDKRLYNQIQYGKQKRQNQADVLTKKRQILAKSQKK